MVSYRVSLYPPFPSNCLGCMAPSVIKNKGTPQMSSLEVLKRERKYNLSKWLNIQIRSSVQQMNPIYDSSIPCLNYHCIIVTEINIIVLYSYLGKFKFRANCRASQNIVPFIKFVVDKIDVWQCFDKIWQIQP